MPTVTTIYYINYVACTTTLMYVSMDVGAICFTCWHNNSEQNSYIVAMTVIISIWSRFTASWCVYTRTFDLEFVAA